VKVGDLVKYFDWADHEIVGMVFKIYQGAGAEWPDLIHMRGLDGEVYSDTKDCFQVIQSFISKKSSTA